jgi:hypothetical protein
MLRQRTRPGLELFERLLAESGASGSDDSRSMF